jgi:hypothetical protein
LEDVRLTPSFQCSLCGKKIRVSSAYRRTQNAVSYIGAIILPYVFGLRGVLWGLSVMPFIFVLAALQAYLVKYVIPPSLEWYTDEFIRLGID